MQNAVVVLGAEYAIVIYKFTISMPILLNAAHWHCATLHMRSCTYLERFEYADRELVRVCRRGSPAHTAHRTHTFAVRKLHGRAHRHVTRHDEHPRRDHAARLKCGVDVDASCTLLRRRCS